MIQRFLKGGLISIVRYYLLVWRLWKFKQDYDDSKLNLKTMYMLASINDLTLLDLASSYLVKKTEINSRFASATELLSWLDLIIEEITESKYVTTNKHIMYVLRNEYTIRLSAFLYNGDKALQPGELQYQLIERLSAIDQLITNVTRREYHEYLNRIITPLIREVFTVQEALLYVALNYEKTKSTND